MGAWSHGGFDDDDAMDWVAGLEEANDITPLTQAFDLILEHDNDDIEAPDAYVGLTAAEVVASLAGKPPTNLPDDVAAWLAGKDAPSAELIEQAQQVVACIVENSELNDLWAESADAALWRREVESLMPRLINS